MVPKSHEYFMPGSIARPRAASGRTSGLTGPGEVLYLVLYQPSPRTFAEIAEDKRADRHTHDPQHLDADRRKDSAQLTILAFVEHDLEPRAAPRPRAQERDRFHLEQLPRVLFDNAGRDAVHHCVELRAAHLDVIHFVDV